MSLRDDYGRHSQFSYSCNIVGSRRVETDAGYVELPNRGVMMASCSIRVDKVSEH